MVVTLEVTETPPQTVWIQREQVAQRKQEVDHRAALMNPQRARPRVSSGPGSSGAALEETAPLLVRRRHVAAAGFEMGGRLLHIWPEDGSAR